MRECGPTRHREPRPFWAYWIASEFQTGTSGRRAGALKQQWARKGRTLALADMIVAAIALERECVLMTDNRKDFPMEELDKFDLART